MKVSKVCILGGTGFVGSHLSARLANAGIECRIISRHPQRHRHLQVLPGTQLIYGDVFNPDDLQRLFAGCDAVINLIGILNEGSRGRTFRRVHTELVDDVVTACRNTKIDRLLHMSAINADEANGTSLYLRSKGEGENRAHTHGQARIKVTSFRPSVIFGPGDSFFNRFAALVRLAPRIFPLACPESRFAPVFVGDVADAFFIALRDRSTWGRHYDLCGPRIFSLRELVEYTAKTIGKRTRILGLSDGLSRLEARVFQLLPGKPFSYDNYLSLQTDSICENNGLEMLGILPHDIKAVVPGYLAGITSRNHVRNLQGTVQRDG